MIKKGTILMKKKILKRVIAVVLSLSVMLSGGTSAFAKQADGPEYTLKDSPCVRIVVSRLSM
jgi:hypothetical protein